MSSLQAPKPLAPEQPDMQAAAVSKRHPPKPRFLEYWRGIEPKDRPAFAERCNKTTVGHLHNVAHSFSPCSAALARAIERETGGMVPRSELRPDDFAVIWPELATA